MQGYCRRCHAVALAQRRLPERRCPCRRQPCGPRLLEPHPGSTVSAAYHVDWPGKHVAELPQLADDALQLDYERIEERTQAQPAAGLLSPATETLCRAYASQRAVAGRFDRGGRAKTACGRSTLLISSAGAGPPPPGDEEQELTIQILSMDLGSRVNNDGGGR